MQPKELDAATLRRLSGMRPEQGKVLSIYLDLDPSELATPAARSSAITSVLDRAGKLRRLDRAVRLLAGGPVRGGAPAAARRHRGRGRRYAVG
jgi:hypothetical protein